MGTHSIVGEGPVCRGENDQCEIGDREHETRFCRFVEMSKVLDPGRRLL